MLAFATRRQKKQSTTTRKLRGGKYTGKGTYGCGFAPALRCEGETVRQFGLFTKLMILAEATKEERKRAIIQPVDPDMKYILYPVKICKVNKTLLGRDNPENNVQSCTLGRYPEDIDNARAVQYIDGGIDFEKFEPKAYNVLPVFQSLQNLFLGLHKIHKAGVSHNDIKPANIVTKESEDGSFVTRFIDIGFIHEMKNGVKKADDLPFGANYYPWPYEMRFAASSPKLPTEKSIKEWYGAYRHSMFKYLPYEFLFKEDGSQKFTFAMGQALYKSISDKAKSSIPALSQTNASNFEKVQERNEAVFKKSQEIVLHKVDTYSLGNTLLYIYDRLIHHRLHKGKIQFEIARTRAYHNLDTLQREGVPEASQKWHEKVAEEISKPYIEMCMTMMMHFDPFERRALPITLNAYKKF